MGKYISIYLYVTIYTKYITSEDSFHHFSNFAFMHLRYISSFPPLNSELNSSVMKWEEEEGMW